MRLLLSGESWIVLLSERGFPAFQGGREKGDLAMASLRSFHTASRPLGAEAPRVEAQSPLTSVIGDPGTHTAMAGGLSQRSPLGSWPSGLCRTIPDAGQREGVAGWGGGWNAFALLENALWGVCSPEPLSSSQGPGSSSLAVSCL